MGDPIVVSTGHRDSPWVTADLTVLNEAAVDVRLDVDLQLLAAERTRDQKLVWHRAILLQMRGSDVCKARITTCKPRQPFLRPTQRRSALCLYKLTSVEMKR